MNGFTDQAFVGMSKIARLSRDMIITEKIDGTNGCIYIDPLSGEFQVGSRTRWITPEDDNFGFARWAYDHKDDLFLLGPGRWFGEWWGSGINRGYGLKEKRFSLFNTTRLEGKVLPSFLSVVPVLYQGPFNLDAVEDELNSLLNAGSVAAPGFMDPEGVVVYHTAANISFKKTHYGDNQPKGGITKK